jgi:hypothetical protein
MVASLVFYAAGDWAFLPVLVGVCVANYALVRGMHGSAYAGPIAAWGIAANLGLLLGCKACGPVPLGLSFFTFSQIGCLLHYAGGDAQPPRARDYALFSGFFPSLTAGPILHPSETLAQFARPLRWSADDAAVGMGWFLIGLLKKTVLADPLAGVVEGGYGSAGSVGLFGAWQAVCGYSLQLYFDFSGYSDMAIGLGRMFGVRLPDNFDRPYRARSVIDYWQRWHMSLTRFLTANVHAPLTVAALRWRRSRGLRIDHAAQCRPIGFLAMIAVPVAATMLLVALWHGFAWTFLVFGALHAGFLLVNHAWRLARRPALPVIGGSALTYLCVLLASVPFRADSLSDAASMLVGMAGGHGVGAVGAARFAWLAALYGVVWVAPSTRQLMEDTRWGGIAMGCACTVGLLAAGGTGEFLYFRF